MVKLILILIAATSIFYVVYVCGVLLYVLYILFLSGISTLERRIRTWIYRYHIRKERKKSLSQRKNKGGKF